MLSFRQEKNVFAIFQTVKAIDVKRQRISAKRRVIRLE